MRKLSGLLAAAAVAVVAVTGTMLTIGPVSAESNGGVRVMPLGDSITDGFNVPGGYRINLWQKFVTGGYRIDFVGSQFNGPASLGDHDHQVGLRAVGDERLRARQHVLVAVPQRPRLDVLQVGAATGLGHGDRADVLAGLAEPVPAIPARWLYDLRGSELFDDITRLDTYYPTRTETALLDARMAEIAAITLTAPAPPIRWPTMDLGDVTATR